MVLYSLNFAIVVDATVWGKRQKERGTNFIKQLNV